MPYTLDKLRKIGMPIAMAALVEAANRRSTVTYGHIAKCIQLKLGNIVANERVGWVVGAMMDEIKRVAGETPPLNALCVNGRSKLPSDGADPYIRNYNPKIDYKNLSASAKREALLPVYEEIFKFKRWPQIARKTFRVSVEKKSSPQLGIEREGKSRRLGFGGPAESKEHRRLKEYVKRHPRRFGAPIGCSRGTAEKRLKSFDEIDVWFVRPGEQLAVEVKSRRSNELDLERGIFQCIKYRAVLEAQNKAEGLESSVRVRLVSENQLPSALTRLAKRFRIEVQVERLK